MPKQTLIPPSKDFLNKQK